MHKVWPLWILLLAIITGCDKLNFNQAEVDPAKVTSSQKTRGTENIEEAFLTINFPAENQVLDEETFPQVEVELHCSSNIVAISCDGIESITSTCATNGIARGIFAPATGANTIICTGTRTLANNLGATSTFIYNKKLIEQPRPESFIKVTTPTENDNFDTNAVGDMTVGGTCSNDLKNLSIVLRSKIGENHSAAILDGDCSNGRWSSKISVSRGSSVFVVSGENAESVVYQDKLTINSKQEFIKFGLAKRKKNHKVFLSTEANFTINGFCSKNVSSITSTKTDIITNACSQNRTWQSNVKLEKGFNKVNFIGKSASGLEKDLVLVVYYTDDKIGECKRTKVEPGLSAMVFASQNYPANNITDYRGANALHLKNIKLDYFNVTPRLYTQGYPINESQVLTVGDDILTEYYSIKSTGLLGLPEGFEKGYYEILAIADDGLELAIDGKTIISRDSIQAPTVRCLTNADDLLLMDKNSKFTFDYQWFQGPRQSIASALYYKRFASKADYKKSSYCGRIVKDEKGVESEGYALIPKTAFTTVPASDELCQKKDELAQIRKRCEQASESEFMVENSKVFLKEVVQGCEWGKNGNLTQKKASAQARKEENTFAFSRGDKIICDFDLSVKQKDYFHDDHMLLHLNNRVILQNYDFTKFAQDDRGLKSDEQGYLIYKWDDIKGAQFTGEAVKPVCIPNLTCDVPDQSVKGDLNFKMNDTSIRHLGTLLNADVNVMLGLVVLGDDNPTDCQSRGIEADLKVRLLKKKK